MVYKIQPSDSQIGQCSVFTLWAQTPKNEFETKKGRNDGFFKPKARVNDCSKRNMKRVMKYINH